MVITALTRNQVYQQWYRGFESHPLRQFVWKVPNLQVQFRHFLFFRLNPQRKLQSPGLCDPMVREHGIHGVVPKIKGIPFQADGLAAPQTIKRTEQDRKLRLDPPGNLKGP